MLYEFLLFFFLLEVQNSLEKKRRGAAGRKPTKTKKGSNEDQRKKKKTGANRIPAQVAPPFALGRADRAYMGGEMSKNLIAFLKEILCTSWEIF